MKLFILLFFLLSGCSSQIGVRSASVRHNTLEEARIALYDVKQALAQQQLQLDLLEEKVDNRKAEKAYNPNTSRVENLEKTQRQILKDLKNLSSHANDTSHTLSQFKKSIQSIETHMASHSKRLGDVVNLKSTLNSISEAIDQSTQIHTVQSGDTLEKIARTHKTSVEKIKKTNNLKSNTIFIGQKLKIS